MSMSIKERGCCESLLIKLLQQPRYLKIITNYKKLNQNYCIFTETAFIPVSVIIRRM